MKSGLGHFDGLVWVGNCSRHGNGVFGFVFLYLKLMSPLTVWPTESSYLHKTTSLRTRLERGKMRSSGTGEPIPWRKRTSRSVVGRCGYHIHSSCHLGTSSSPTHPYSDIHWLLVVKAAHMINEVYPPSRCSLIRNARRTLSSRSDGWPEI